MLTGHSAAKLAPLDVPRFAPQAPQARMDDWIARAENASPELQALRAQGEAARLEVPGHLSTLDAVAGWSRSNSDSVTSVNARYEQKTFGLQLNIPLYSGGAVNAQVRQALARSGHARPWKARGASWACGCARSFAP